MMSSIPCLRSVPGASRSMEASRRGSRRGSNSDGDRVKPRVLCLSALSGIEASLDRPSQRLVLLDVQFATCRRPGRDENALETELGALLEPPVGLRRWTQPARESDLAEGGEGRANGCSPGRRG